MPASSNTLFTQYVEFVSKGFEQVDAKIDALKTKMEDSTKAGDAMAKKTQEAGAKFGDMAGMATKAATIIGGAATAAFATLTGTIIAFTRAGLQGTVEGFRLQFAFQMLSREVAGVFLPIVTKLISVVERITQWFARLTERQQNMVQTLALMTAGMLAGVAAAAALTVAILGVVTALVAADAALGGIPLVVGLIVTGVVGLVTAIGGLVGGLGALGATSGTGARILGMLGDAFEKVWNFIQPGIAAMMSFAQISGSLFEISLKLYGALIRPFADLFSKLSGGNPLEKVADVLDRIANFIEDYIAPAFEALANIIENTLNAALDKVFQTLEAIGQRLGVLREAFMKLIPQPVLDALNRLFGMTRLSAPDEGGHRRPTRMDVGTESAQQTYQRFADAVMKMGTKNREEENAKNLENVAQWTEAINGVLASFSLDNVVQMLAQAIADKIRERIPLIDVVMGR